MAVSITPKPLMKPRQIVASAYVTYQGSDGTIYGSPSNTVLVWVGPGRRR